MAVCNAAASCPVPFANLFMCGTVLMCLLQPASLLELEFIYRLLCTLETAVERYSSFLSPPAGDAGGGIFSCDGSVVFVVSSLKPSAAHEALGSDSTDRMLLDRMNAVLEEQVSFCPFYPSLHIQCAN